MEGLGLWWFDIRLDPKDSGSAGAELASKDIAVLKFHMNGLLLLRLIDQCEVERRQHILVVEPFELKVEDVFEEEVNNGVMLDLVEALLSDFGRHDPAADVKLNGWDVRPRCRSAHAIQNDAMHLAVVEAWPLPERGDDELVILDSFVRFHKRPNIVLAVTHSKAFRLRSLLFLQNICCKYDSCT